MRRAGKNNQSLETVKLAAGGVEAAKSGGKWTAKEKHRHSRVKGSGPTPRGGVGGRVKNRLNKDTPYWEELGNG